MQPVQEGVAKRRLAVALAEELGYRFFAGTWLLQWTGRRWLAIVVPAVIYGLTHTRLDFLPPAEPWWARALVLTLVGAVWAKGAFRLVGTMGGAVFAVLCVGLFAQAGPLFILAMALWLAFCTYGATLARNYASYGFALAGFSAPLIGFGSVFATTPYFSETRYSRNRAMTRLSAARLAPFPKHWNSHCPSMTSALMPVTPTPALVHTSRCSSMTSRPASEAKNQYGGNTASGVRRAQNSASLAK